MGGIEYVYWPGTTTRLTPWMLECLQKLDADLRRLFDVQLTLDSSGTQRGIRTHQEQVDLFLSRYRVQWSGDGPFGDVRYWQGRRYVRHSGLGTVAQPGTSNHEIQDNYYAAVDLADSGGAGIGTMGSNRSNWLRANAGKYGLEPEGFKFKEAWHYRVPNIFKASSASGGSSSEETLIMNENDKAWLNGMGASIKADVINALKADIATVHQSVLTGTQSILDELRLLRADVNYIHIVSPYSLKNILEAARNGEVTLTDEEVKALGDQLAAASVAGIDAALRDDFEAVKKQLALLPKETLAALKAAL